MDTQFPPSSPVREALHPSKNAVVAPLLREHAPLYPTPHPSSAFRSSSPVRDHADSPAAKRVRFSTPPLPFTVRLPYHDVTRVVIPSPGSSVLVGRLSQRCEYPVNPHNRLVLRVHVMVAGGVSTITITCVGHNGVHLTVPRRVSVSYVGGRHHYEGKVGEETLFGEMAELGVSSQTRAVVENATTQVFILKGESLTVPRMDGLLVDIRGESVLLEEEDGDCTDEEAGASDFKTQAVEGVVTLSKVIPREEAVKPVPQAAAVQTPAFTIYEDVAPQAMSTPCSTPPPVLAPMATVPQVLKPVAKQAVKKTAQEAATKTETLDIPVDLLAKLPVTLPVELPVTLPVELPVTLPVELPPRAFTALPSPSPLDLPPNLAQIKHILINHLAFSRLASTPLSALADVSHVTAELSRTQLRAVVQDTPCLGVIYREGKDAAGKALDEEFYYVPDADTDMERRQLVQNLRGGKLLRSCRKVHKQYFWKKPARR